MHVHLAIDGNSFCILLFVPFSLPGLTEKIHSSLYQWDVVHVFLLLFNTGHLQKLLNFEFFQTIFWKWSYSSLAKKGPWAVHITLCSGRTIQLSNCDLFAIEEENFSSCDPDVEDATEEEAGRYSYNYLYLLSYVLLLKPLSFAHSVLSGGVSRNLAIEDDYVSLSQYSILILDIWVLQCSND